MHTTHRGGSRGIFSHDQPTLTLPTGMTTTDSTSIGTTTTNTETATIGNQPGRQLQL